jgi:hypothetical protein
VDEIPAVTVDDTAKRVELSADIDVSNVDMPVLMGLQRLVKTRPFLGGFALAGTEQAGPLENTVNTGGTDGDDIGIEHPVSETPIPFQGVAIMKRHDRRLLPIFQPEIAWERGVVLVGVTKPVKLGVSEPESLRA